ncbi:MAG: sigma-54-dependent Fis family transcriptional regulator [Anaerovoracaceae bacterium]|jgi:transcriptional regulator of acetoin/glycerol metabolism
MQPYSIDERSQNLIKDIWNDMSTGKQYDSYQLRQVIKESWLRCKSYGLDPYCPKVFSLTQSELKALKHGPFQTILETAYPFMEQLYEIVRGSGFVVMLCNHEGFLLELVGDQDVIEDAQNITLSCGVNWSEQYMGTTAIGVCIETGKPIQIVGSEHYLQGCHSWTCSGAPIFNDKGELKAVLNMSAQYEKVHSHTLGMVVAAANAITHVLKCKEIKNRLEINNHFLISIMENMSDGLITINQQGKINHINNVAASLLKIRNINDPMLAQISAKLRLVDALNTGYNYTDREISFDLAESTVHCSVTVRPIHYDNKIIGALATLREISSVRRLVHNIIGSKALFTFDDILGESKSIKQAKESARFIVNVSQTVMISGESGTGKEVFAQAIHNGSNRRKGPFVAINCAAVPRELVGSELFGYVEGAFTGARRHGAPGKFELADGGTIFLDEIGDMPLEQQSSLLRVLEERQVTRIGEEKARPIDVRVIAASNRDLIKEVNEGRFRKDLFYRLFVLHIRIPPLREREGDAEFLARHFLNKFNLDFNMNAYFTEEAIKIIRDYEWPGNVREVQNVVQQAILLSRGNAIKAEHISINHPRKYNDLHKVATLENMEYHSIKETLNQCEGNVTKAAEILGISRATLYRKIKKMKKDI